ncbi:Non-specific serine/threonine protein kinase protein, partial [Dioscorea alata]
MNFKAVITVFMEVYLLLVVLALSFSVSMTKTQPDHLALKSFKDGVTQDPKGILRSWNQSTHFCQWAGVTCSNPKHPQRVTSLDLSSQNLTGTISPSITNLTFLTELYLMENNFDGQIPLNVGLLHRLQYLNLSYNSMHGEFPTSLSNCTNLRLIDLNDNYFSGNIPSELGSLIKLGTFGLFNNNFTGIIPASLGNISSLRAISFGKNKLHGPIPKELGRLQKMNYLNMGDNNLSGSIPLSLFNISSLSYLYLPRNMLEGELPSTMCTSLLNLEGLYLASNLFTGPLPSSLPNATRLSIIDFVDNNFLGRVPPDLGKSQDLVYVNLNLNNLDAGDSDSDGWQFLTSLTNCSNLHVLCFAANEFAGAIPNSIANLSTQLQTLQIQRNQLSGNIPDGIGNLVGLSGLALYDNLVSGPIPASIGKLAKLQYLGMFGNRLTGTIPSSIGNLTKLNYIGLANNLLEGHIPMSLANLQQLTSLVLSNNHLNGTIPKEIVSMSSISYVFSLANNSLVGPLPTEVGKLKNLEALYLSGNKLSGQIPAALGGCQILEYLRLDGNDFQGTIPYGLSDIKGLRQLHLSHNNLTGFIPEFLATMRGLEDLDLSFNNFNGTVPTEGIFGNASLISVFGNAHLCGGIPELHLPKCIANSVGSSSSKRKLTVIVIVSILISFLFIILVLLSFGYLYMRRRKTSKAPAPHSSLEDQYPRISYAELAKATNGFSSENLVGKGRYGSVYKGSLDNGNTFVAVKVFKLEETGASKSFIAECETLRSVRHRNLSKIITCCSSIDSDGNDFKALVFDFMSNGSLEDRLHGGGESSNNLTLMQRLNIATDIADALEYLHHSCEPSIVHCDLKPSNILIDDEMGAHVGDFGLAKLLPEAISRSLMQESSCSTGIIRGSIGYVAPEYGGGAQVSTAGDVFSFGIVLLELFTRKRPVSDAFKDGLSLCDFVKMAFPDRVMDIVDPSLMLEQDQLGGLSNNVVNQRDEHARRFHECLVSVLKLGLSCSNSLPRERMNMQDVAVEIRVIRHVYSAL